MYNNFEIDVFLERMIVMPTTFETIYNTCQEFIKLKNSSIGKSHFSSMPDKNSTSLSTTLRNDKQFIKKTVEAVNALKKKLNDDSKKLSQSNENDKHQCQKNIADLVNKINNAVASLNPDERSLTQLACYIRDKATQEVTDQNVKKIVTGYSTTINNLTPQCSWLDSDKWASEGCELDVENNYSVKCSKRVLN